MKLIRQLWYLLSPRERVEGAFLLAALALGALFEAISIGLVVPVIAVVRDPSLLSKVPVIQPLVIGLHLEQSQRLIEVFGVGLVLVFAIKSVYLMQLYRWLFRYIFRKHLTLSRQLLMGYLNAPYTFHLQRNSAELIRITTRTVEDFTFGFLVNLLLLLGESLIMAAVILLLLLVEPTATLGAVVILALPTALIYRAMQQKLGKAGRLAEQSLDLEIQWTEQAIGGIKETLITGRQSFFSDMFDRYVNQFGTAMRSMMFLTTVSRFVIDTLAVTAMVATVIILLASGRDLLSMLPLLGMFAFGAVRLMPSVGRMTNAGAKLRFYYAATEVMYEELQKSAQDLSEQPVQGSKDGQSKPFSFQGSLKLQHVSYSYPGAQRPALNNISLEIPKGHWIALIGPTGAGKTTLADTILGLFLPTSGKILADGYNIHDDLHGWQRRIGYVPQSVYLMDDTVRRNVAFGVPEDEIDDQRVWHALRAAHVEQLIRGLPGELDAMVGERGDRLSGGERQRLGIARALYYDPEVLVVDEATANLDSSTEAAIGETLASLRGEKTIVAIAHRLQLVRNCDCIYLLADGCVRSFGTYSDLLSAEPDFLRYQEISAAPRDGSIINGDAR